MKFIRNIIILGMFFLVSTGVDATIPNQQKSNEIQDALQKNVTTDTSTDEEKQLKKQNDSINNQQKNIDEDSRYLNSNNINSDSQHKAQ